MSLSFPTDRNAKVPLLTEKGNNLLQFSGAPATPMQTFKP